MFTHKNPEALWGGEYFTRVVWQLIHGKEEYSIHGKDDYSIYGALEQVCSEMSHIPFVVAQCDKGRNK